MRTKFYTIRSNGKLVRIPIDQIVCVKVCDYLSTFYLEKPGGAKYYYCKPLKLILKELPENFIKVSRSCIVNIDMIRELDKRKSLVWLANHRTVFVSKSKLKELSGKLKNKVH